MRSNGVRKLSGEAADMFGFVRRGYLREGTGPMCCLRSADGGAWPAAPRARLPVRRRTPDRRPPHGVRHVLVNGTPIRSDGRSLIDSLEARPVTRPEIA